MFLMQKAKECLESGLSLWLPQWRELCEKTEGEGGDLDPLETCPVSYPARINVTKILVELEDFNVTEISVSTLLPKI